VHKIRGGKKGRGIKGSSEGRHPVQHPEMGMLTGRKYHCTRKITKRAQEDSEETAQR